MCAYISPDGVCPFFKGEEKNRFSSVRSCLMLVVGKRFIELYRGFEASEVLVKINCLIR